LKHFAAPADVESLVRSIQLALSQPNKSDANAIEKDLIAEETFTMERFFQELFKNTLH
jgi:hypothetical protein